MSYPVTVPYVHFSVAPRLQPPNIVARRKKPRCTSIHRGFSFSPLLAHPPCINSRGLLSARRRPDDTDSQDQRESERTHFNLGIFGV